MCNRIAFACLGILAAVLPSDVTAFDVTAGDDIAPLVRFQRTETHMGTSFGIVLYAADEKTANRAFDAAFARISTIDRICSDYDVDSELSQLGARSPTVKPIKVSDDLYRVLLMSRHLSEQSDGAFDITIGAITRQWRRARSLKKLPNPVQLQELLKSVGYQNLIVHESEKQVELTKPNMRLDLGGIAPGFAANEALITMRDLGVTRALVNASGDLCVGDAPADAKAWKIDIAPLEPNGPPTQSVWLANASISTSGDAFQFLEIDGKRYSHIVDPRTGYGLTQRSSVTVITTMGKIADGLGTAVSVLGPDKGMQLIESIPGAAAYIVAIENEKPKTYASSRFRQFTSPP
jgi:thiamine biosynthesis lipoprotein